MSQPHILCKRPFVFKLIKMPTPFYHGYSQKTWNNEDALQYIKDQSGKFFDPSLVPLFIKIAPEVISYQQQHP